MKITAIAPETPDYFPQAEPNAMEQRGKLELLTRTAASTYPSQKENDPSESENTSLQTVQRATEAMEAYMASSGVNLKFSIDDRTDTVQVEIRNSETDKIIRKIPADEMLNLAVSIEKMVGIFLNKTL